MSNVPKIRFPGFTGPWEQRKLSELIGRTYGGGTPATSKEYYWNGDIPWIQSSNVVEDQLFNVGVKKHISKSGLQHSAAQLIPENSVAVVTHVGVGKLVFMPYSYTTSQDFISLGNIHCEPKFLCYALYKKLQEDLHVVQGSAIKGITKEDLMGKSISLPVNSEQKRIASTMQGIDNLITLHQCKLNNLKEYKKGMLQKMFPAKASNRPEIRFPDFTEPWEQRKFSELYKRNDEKNGQQFGWNRTLSISTMTFNEEGNGASDSSLNNYKVLRVGDIAFEGHTNKEFRYGRFVLNDTGDGIMSPRFTTLRPISEQDFSFWKLYIHDESVMRKKLVNSTKAGTMMNELVIDDLMKQIILVPTLDEQHKIGAYFKNLDNLITLHQHKLDDLKELKKGLLQQMFVND